jgi:shikimate 5-dehydrogenase
LSLIARQSKANRLQFAYEFTKSPLLQQMRARSEAGWVVVDGLDVLPEQGFEQFELFTRRIAPRSLMRREVLRTYKQGAPQDEQADIELRLRILEQKNVLDW